MMVSFLGRARLRTCHAPVRHLQHLLNPICRPGRSLTTLVSPPRPTTPALGTSKIALSLGRILDEGRKSSSTTSQSEPQPGSEHTDSPFRLILPADLGPDDKRRISPTMGMIRVNFPEEDGFYYTWEPLARDITYTEIQDGKEVEVTIPRDRTQFWQAARPRAVQGGPPRPRVNGVKQDGVVCAVLTVLPPAPVGSELGNDAMFPLSVPQKLESDASIDAIAQAVLEEMKRIQDVGWPADGVMPLGSWLDGCLTLMFMESAMMAYEYSKEKGLYDLPVERFKCIPTKPDAKMRRQLGLPDSQAESQSESMAESQPGSQPEPADSPAREALTDPFPGVATRIDVVESYTSHYEGKYGEDIDKWDDLDTKARSESGLLYSLPENDPSSLYSLREMALSLPHAFLQSQLPEADGFFYANTGSLPEDIKYTEVSEGGEEVVVTIPWDNTRLWLAARQDCGPVCAALYVLPPAGATPWGRGISTAAMDAAEQALQEHIKRLAEGYEGMTPFGVGVDGCTTAVLMGVEMSMGVYSEETGLQGLERALLATEEVCSAGVAAAIEGASKTLVRFKDIRPPDY